MNHGCRVTSLVNISVMFLGFPDKIRKEKPSFSDFENNWLRTDRRTDGRTDGPSYRDARTHLKRKSRADIAPRWEECALRIAQVPDSGTGRTMGEAFELRLSAREPPTREEKSDARYSLRLYDTFFRSVPKSRTAD